VNFRVNVHVSLVELFKVDQSLVEVGVIGRGEGEGRKADLDHVSKVFAEKLFWSGKVFLNQ
jgi:hypothetical protein